MAAYLKLISYCLCVLHSKATSLDGTFPPAWIGYGNAYAAKDEGDQAMSAYRTAARLFPGYCSIEFFIIVKCYSTIVFCVIIKKKKKLLFSVTLPCS